MTVLAYPISQTPGAYKIPKAGSDGKLAAGWIPDLSGTYLTVIAAAANYEPIDIDLRRDGKTGGQTAYGGTGSGENLTLLSTSNATKGSVIISSFAAFDGATPKLTLSAPLVLSGAPGIIRPAADSTSAIQVAQAGGTVFVTLDTTNKRMRLGDAAAPGVTLGVATVDASTNVATDVLALWHKLSAGTPTTSFGTSILFGADSATVVDRTQGRLFTSWIDATDATRTSSFTVRLTKSAAAFDVITMRTNTITVATTTGVLLGGGAISNTNGSAHPLFITPSTTGQVVNFGDFEIVKGINATWSGMGIRTDGTNTTMKFLGKANSGGSGAAFTFSSGNPFTLRMSLDFGGQITIGSSATTPAKLGVIGEADEIQTIVRGHSTQTNDIFEVQRNSGSAVVLAITDAGLATFTARDAATTTVTLGAIVDHASSGTPAAGFGTGFRIRGQSSTTVSQDMARWRAYWNTATHASRKAYAVLSAFDTAERDVIGIGANGSAGLLGFFGVATAPVLQQSGTGETVGFTAGSGTTVHDDSTFTGNVGATAYRISDLVKAMKNYGLLAA